MATLLCSSSTIDSPHPTTKNYAALLKKLRGVSSVCGRYLILLRSAMAAHSANDGYSLSSVHMNCGTFDTYLPSLDPKIDSIPSLNAYFSQGFVLHQNSPLTKTVPKSLLANMPVSTYEIPAISANCSENYVSDATTVRRISGLVNGTYTDFAQALSQSRETKVDCLERPSLCHSNHKFGPKSIAPGDAAFFSRLHEDGTKQSSPITHQYNAAPTDSSHGGIRKKRKTNQNQHTRMVLAKIKSCRSSSVKGKELNHKSLKHSNQTEKPVPPNGFIHVRARRGEATDSHSLAERARRKKIKERMRLLEELVPGCHKASGKAVMLDEIINYVQSLKNQVEFLSMRLSVASACYDRDLEIKDYEGKEASYQTSLVALQESCRKVDPMHMAYSQGTSTWIGEPQPLNITSSIPACDPLTNSSCSTLADGITLEFTHTRGTNSTRQGKRTLLPFGTQRLMRFSLIEILQIIDFDAWTP
eukprot:Gb_07223 [translate_table: standard]